MLQIDKERCIDCGLCARDCPALCFRVNEEGVSVRREDNCLRCGHCVAICPRSAVSLDGVAGDSRPALRPFMPFDDFDNLARGRRSVRAFKEELVSRETLLRALDTARFAPTGKNLENVEWVVYEGRPALRKIADAVIDLFRQDKALAALVRSHDMGHDPIFRNAPCAVFACAEGEYGLNACNCDIAATYLELALPTLGLGTCWAGFAMRAAQTSPTVLASFGLREGLMPWAGLMVGIPAVRYARIPERRPLRVQWVSSENDA